jgi:hypothetical protein
VQRMLHDGKDEKSIQFSVTNLEIRYHFGNVKMDHSEIGWNVSSGSGYRPMTTSINTALRLHVAYTVVYLLTACHIQGVYLFNL